MAVRQPSTPGRRAAVGLCGPGLGDVGDSLGDDQEEPLHSPARYCELLLDTSIEKLQVNAICPGRHPTRLVSRLIDKIFWETKKA